MSHTLETLDGRPNRFAAADFPRFGPHDAGLESLMRACNDAALEVASESMVFFSVPTSRLIRVNRAACQCLGYTQHQLQSMLIQDIAPQATRSNLAQICVRAARSADHEARVRTVYRHGSGALVPVDCSIRMVSTLPE